MTDRAQLQALREELFAYLSGDIHEGENDVSLRAMFRDFDAVKKAWEKLIQSEVGSSGQFVLPKVSDAISDGRENEIHVDEIRRLLKIQTQGQTASQPVDPLIADIRSRSGGQTASQPIDPLIADIRSRAAGQMASQPIDPLIADIRSRGAGQAEIDYRIAEYAAVGKELDYDAAQREFVNDYIGEMIANPETLDRFINENRDNRTLLQKVADALRALWQKLTGQERQQVKTAEDALLAALRASEKQTTALEKAGQTMDFSTEMANTGTEYLLRGMSKDGIEIYETSKEVRALPWRERKQRFLRIMQEQYQGRTVKFTAKDGEVYYAKFDDADIQKNIYGDKRSDSAGQDAKINVGADGGIFDLVENATHKSSDIETGKKGRAHRDVTGWEYFVKTVQIDDRVFDLLANIRKKPDGEYVYSIQLNENKTKSVSPIAVYANSVPASERGTTDNGSIS